MIPIYTLYIPKKKGAKRDFPITKVIHNYINVVNLNCIFLMAPGYLSKTKNTIKCFVDELNKSTDSTKHKHSVAVFNGMNGTISLVTPKSTTTVRDYHEATFAKSNISCIPVSCKTDIDHRKMLFIMKLKDGKKMVKVLNKNSQQSFLDSVQVIGVFIGSSNQSYQSYYGGSSQTADKGEADIFMFIDERYASKINDVSLQDDLVLSKSLRVPYGDGEKYLNSLLKEYVDYYLN